MNDLLARSPVFYRESADGRLVFGNKTALEPGGFIELVIGTDTFRVPVDDKGFYRWEAPTPYADGEYSFSIRHFDAAGNRSTPTLGTVIVDTTAPAAPKLFNLYDDQGAVTGSFDAGQTTDDKRPTLTGIAQKGSTVYLLNDKNEKIGSAVADKVTGQWVMEPAQDLKDGVNSLRLMAEETFGGKLRAGAPSEVFDIVIAGDDVKVTITDALDDAGSFTGSLGNGALTDDTTPTLRGSGPANSTITLRYKLDGGSYASTTVNVDNAGKWTWTPSALAKGNWTFEVQKAGQSGWSSFTLTIDPALDLKPTIDGAWDDVGAVTGSLKSGDTTDDSTPTLRGRGMAGSVIYFQSGTWDGSWYDVGSTVVKADGSWEWTSPALSQSNTWEFRALARHDGAESDWSGKFVLEYKTPAPAITDAFDDFGAETGSLASGDTTDDNTPTLRGTAPANSMVMIRAQHESGEKTYSVKADAYGKWSWTPNKALAKGGWDFQVKTSDSDNWGDKFELNLNQYPSSRYTLDFETTVLGPMGGMQKYLDDTNVALIFLGATNPGEVVSKPNDVPESFNDRCLRLKNINTIEIYLVNKNYVSNPFFKDVGFQIWNSNNFDITIVLKPYYNRGYMPVSTTKIIKAGEVVDISCKDYLEANNADKLSLLDISINSGLQGVYIDNLYVDVVRPESTQTLDISDENIVHFLDGVDQLTDHPITGSETQVDTLQLTGKDQLLDLSQHKAEIQSVEIFDIRGSGDNTLKIDLDALLHYGEKDLFIEDGKTQLMVNGDAGDVVQLKDILPEGSDISEWQHQQGTVTVAGVEYEVYSHGDDAELLVQQGVKTELI
ncbi:hypothetical protein ACVLVH_001363 [Kluyvera sp. 1366]|jgi:hypothetical protein